MKKIIAATILAAASVAPAMAADTYVFGNVGHTTIDGNPGDFKDSGIAGGLGIKFNQHLGAEVGYSYLGKDAGVRADAYSASLVGRYALTNEFTARGKLGVANSGLYTKAGNAEVGVRGNDAVFGLGVEYALDRNFNLVGEYERFNNVGASKDAFGDRLNADRFSVGVQYKF